MAFSYDPLEFESILKCRAPVGIIEINMIIFLSGREFIQKAFKSLVVVRRAEKLGRAVQAQIKVRRGVNKIAFDSGIIHIAKSDICFLE